jgi:hypothetical protein
MHCQIDWHQSTPLWPTVADCVGNVMRPYLETLT